MELNLEIFNILEEYIFHSRTYANSYESIYSQKFKIIDLFCGAGGMTLGFSKKFGHNFESVWANDFNKYCSQTFVTNFNSACITGDLVEILENNEEIIPQADVVIGGPPCQGFSLLNRKRDNDPRRQLWIPFLEVVRRSRAKVFVIENVKALLNTQEHFDIVSAAERMGFKIWSGKLLAADYGVPQARWRTVIVGSLQHDPSYIFPLRKTHLSDKIINNHNKFNTEKTIDIPKTWRTVKNAIYDLPAPKGNEHQNITPPLNLHFTRKPTKISIMRYKAIPNEGMNRFDLEKNAPEITPECWKRKKSGGTDLFGRLWWDKPAVTIRTEFFKPEKGRYLHPSQHRPITHREAARFQSFPDDFIFIGSKTEIAKQIGNAVPPVFAARIADAVTTLLIASQLSQKQIKQIKKRLDQIKQNRI